MTLAPCQGVTGLSPIVRSVTSKMWYRERQRKFKQAHQFLIINAQSISVSALQNVRPGQPKSASIFPFVKYPVATSLTIILPSIVQSL